MILGRGSWGTMSQQDHSGSCVGVESTHGRIGASPAEEPRHPCQPRASPAHPQTGRGPRSRLRTLTRAAVVAAAGATVAIGVVVAHDHPGAGGPARRLVAQLRPVDDHAGGTSSRRQRRRVGRRPVDPGNTGDTGNTGTSTARSSSSPSRRHSGRDLRWTRDRRPLRRRS